MIGKTLLCAVRGHREVGTTLHMSPESITVQRRCTRCGVHLGEPVERRCLARYDLPALGLPTRYAYATGEVGECGHELAYGCPVCGADFCPTCDFMCSGCRRMREAFDRMLTESIVALDAEMLDLAKEET